MMDDGTLSVGLLETYLADDDLLDRLVNDFNTLDALDRSTEEEATNLGYSQTEWVKIGKAIKSAVESWNKSGDAYVSECIQRIDLEVQKYPEIVVCKMHFDSMKKCLMNGEKLTRILEIHGDLFSHAARRVLRIELLETKNAYCHKMHCYIIGSKYKTMRKEAWKKSKNARKKALKKAAKVGDATGSQVLGVSGAGADKDGEQIEKDTVETSGGELLSGAEKDGEQIENDTVLTGSGAGADKDGELLQKDEKAPSGGDDALGTGVVYESVEKGMLQIREHIDENTNATITHLSTKMKDLINESDSHHTNAISDLFTNLLAEVKTIKTDVCNLVQKVESQTPESSVILAKLHSLTTKSESDLATLTSHVQEIKSYQSVNKTAVSNIYPKLSSLKSDLQNLTSKAEDMATKTDLAEALEKVDTLHSSVVAKIDTLKMNETVLLQSFLNQAVDRLAEELSKRRFDYSLFE